MTSYLLRGLVLLVATIVSVQASSYSNKAMIWNAGKYFYNYRMEVSSHYIRNMLTDSGFDSKDIIQVKADNIICNSNAVDCPSLRYIPDQSDSALRNPYEADYSMRDNNPTKYLELIVNRYEPRESNSRKIVRDENTNFFFYTIGHGGDLYFKIQDTEVIFAQQVADYLNDPAQSIKHRESFLLSDSCSAGTLFSLSQNVDRTYMLGTSSWDQASTSYDQDVLYSQPLNDKFLFHFKRLIWPMLSKQDMVSVHKLKNQVNNDLLLSDLLTFNNLQRTDMLVYLNDYMIQHDGRAVDSVKVHSERTDALIDGFFGQAV